MRTKVVLSVMGLLLLLLVGWWIQWFYANHEQQTREIKTDVSPLAKRNPLLAAELFLRRIGLQSESVSGRDFLLNPPEATGLLVVSRLGGSLPEERQEALLAWVRRGGHLVISPPSGWGDDDAQANSLLDYLGVEVFWPDSEGQEGDSSGAALGSADAHAPILFQLPGVAGEVAVAFTDQRVLFDSRGHAEWQVESDEGAHLLQFDIGRGQITVLSDQAFFSNARIGEHDHALFLAQLAVSSSRVWLLYSSEMPSLIQLLWRQASELVISLMGLLLLIVWFMTQRSGPVLVAESFGRRNLMEHLIAVGHYVWKVDQARETFTRSQAALEQRWLTRHPLLAGMKQEERCQWIADHAGLMPASVSQALYGHYQGEHEFIQVTATQQRLVAQLYKQRNIET
ncbi:MAG: DUF4350 domain-containing protein [Sedimenticola sp.]|nr:DUF4350 domain-containing protein [Sedimenticola sp.]